MSTRTQILVIGGGVIGICAAYYLTRRGYAVTLVEKNDIASGCSYGNTGLLVPSHSIPLATPGVLWQGLKWLFKRDSPLYIRPRLSLTLARWLWHFAAACNHEQVLRAIPLLLELNQASLELFQELQQKEDLDFGYVQHGGLFLYNSSLSLGKDIEYVHILNRYGVGVAVLDADEVRRVEPNVLDTVIGGIYYRQDAHLIPDRFVCELAHLTETLGAKLITKSEVLDFQVRDKQIQSVITSHDEFEPEQIIMTAGAWSSDILRQMGLNLSMQPAKGYTLTLESPPNSPHIPLHLTERKVVVAPMGNRLRIGGTLELDGMELSVNLRRVEAICQAVDDYLPLTINHDSVEIWHGLRPLTADTLPVIGRSKDLKNLIVATGHGMLGVSLGPITGLLVSQLIDEEKPVFDLSLLAVERFS